MTVTLNYYYKGKYNDLITFVDVQTLRSTWKAIPTTYILYIYAFCLLKFWLVGWLVGVSININIVEC